MRTILILGLSVFAYAAAAESTSIVGKWRTFDEKTKKPKGVVEIAAAGEEFNGILRETSSTKTVCAVCPGAKKDQPLRGMEIISKVKAKGKGEWGGGEILDPENGKTYRVKFALDDDGKKLNVRGYIGISLLGRSQVWERVTEVAEATP